MFTIAVAKMKSLSLIVNTLLKKINKNQFEALKCLYIKIFSHYPIVKALSFIDPLMMKG